MRIHLTSLPHTETTRAFSWCAYTQKVRRFADMLTALGHHVILYGGEGNEAAVAEHVVVAPRRWQQRHFGHLNFRGGDTWNGYDVNASWWREMNGATAVAMAQRAEPGDYLGIIAGECQRPLMDAFPEMTPVEWGVGYQGVIAPYRVYESQAWMGHVAALRGELDFRPYDAVIPNSWHPDEFAAGDGKGDYLLFMGRLIARKGPHWAAAAAKAAGMKLLVAGQEMSIVEPGRLTTRDGTLIEGDVEYVGVVGPEERSQLMGGARAVLTPTQYFEPFGGVAVEAQLCGTPAITTNWSCFGETVVQGETGFRCNTLADFKRAIDQAGGLDRAHIRDRALALYSTERVRSLYQGWFDRLSTLSGDGWYDLQGA